jgi:parallel beta-helix repeat protein
MKLYLTRQKLHSWAVALCLFAAVSLIPAQAKTLTVNCPFDPGTATSIGGAVSIANSGDTVVVCPGFYFENVVVMTSHLTIRSLVFGAAKVWAFSPADPSLSGFQLNASYDTVQGFSISGYQAGIDVEGPNGHERLTNNSILSGAYGINLHDSLNNVVEDNWITLNFNSGVLDYVDVAPGAGDTGNRYQGNKLQYNFENGIFINTNTTASFPNGRATVTGNTIDNNLLDGILLTNSSAVTVAQNDLSYNGQDGIELVGSTNNVLSGNTANQNGASISSCGPTRGAGECDGLHLHSNATGNTVRQNIALGNLVWDAQDNSTGSGTAGTANTWTRDVCPNNSPQGICGH